MKGTDFALDPWIWWARKEKTTEQEMTMTTKVRQKSAERTEKLLAQACGVYLSVVLLCSKASIRESKAILPDICSHPSGRPLREPLPLGKRSWGKKLVKFCKAAVCRSAVTQCLIPHSTSSFALVQCQSWHQ